MFELEPVLLVLRSIKPSLAFTILTGLGSEQRWKKKLFCQITLQTEITPEKNTDLQKKRKGREQVNSKLLSFILYCSVQAELSFF